MKPNTIAVIGGTGRTGKCVVEQLIRKGFRIRMLVRPTQTDLPDDPRIEMVTGNAIDPRSIRTLLAGCNALISTLGYRPEGPATIFSATTRNILPAMCESGIRRYIVVAGLNVDVSGDRKSAATQAATAWMKTHYPETSADRQLEYELLAKSDLDWTLARLPMISVSDAVLPVITSLEDIPGEGITTASLASFLVNQLLDTAFVCKSPFVANS